MSKNKVSDFVYNRIMSYASNNNSSGELANLRKGYGKSCFDVPMLVSGACFHGMDESMLGKKVVSKEQHAAYTALTAFAAHQQGKDIKKDIVHEKGITFGKAVSRIIDGDETSNSMLTNSKMLYRLSESRDMKEFNERLKHFISLFKQKNVKLDYYDFASDVYYFQFKNGNKNVKLKWCTDLSRGMYEKTKDNNNKESIQSNNVA